MDLLTATLPFAIVIIFILLDIFQKINLMKPLFILPALFIQVNLPLVIALLWENPPAFYIMTPVAVFILYIVGRFYILPVRSAKSGTIRLTIMIGGRFITLYALWLFTLECLFLLISGIRLFYTLTPAVLLTAVIYTAGSFLFLFWNGLLRMFFTSKRLSVARRLLMIFTMWIPLINFAVFVYACQLVRDEYDFALYKRDLRTIRAESDLCRTRYPIILVHGIFFRDSRYFNYWGRIPGELTRCGATLYYGNQEAVGTVAHNAGDIRRKILEVMEETGSPKVNIIAHSKGGLDSRYAISKLGMNAYVASLTTMNTPHRGCRFVDNAMKLPRPFIQAVASAVNRTFHRFGDQNPDFYNAVMQFTTGYSRAFNEDVVNTPEVYYQSYMTKMKSLFSDSMLSIPYLFIRLLEGDNDGLVSVNSARWGDYRGLLYNQKRRGISHGDIIDLKREDYNGFDVVEFYVGLLHDLKKKGY